MTVVSPGIRCNGSGACHHPPVPAPVRGLQEECRALSNVENPPSSLLRVRKQRPSPHLRPRAGGAVAGQDPASADQNRHHRPRFVRFWEPGRSVPVDEHHLPHLTAGGGLRQTVSVFAPRRDCRPLCTSWRTPRAHERCRPGCSAGVLGRGARPGCSAGVLGRGARPWCSAVVLGGGLRGLVADV